VRCFWGDEISLDPAPTTRDLRRDLAPNPIDLMLVVRRSSRPRRSELGERDAASLGDLDALGESG
jgi:isochorismate hydrolase